eukprot:1972497-Prymnesium_polylepis.1
MRAAGAHRPRSASPSAPSSGGSRCSTTSTSVSTSQRADSSSCEMPQQYSATDGGGRPPAEANDWRNARSFSPPRRSDLSTTSVPTSRWRHPSPSGVPPATPSSMQRSSLPSPQPMSARELGRSSPSRWHSFSTRSAPSDGPPSTPPASSKSSAGVALCTCSRSMQRRSTPR